MTFNRLHSSTCIIRNTLHQQQQKQLMYLYIYRCIYVYMYVYIKKLKNLFLYAKFWMKVETVNIDRVEIIQLLWRTIASHQSIHKRVKTFYYSLGLCDILQSDCFYFYEILAIFLSCFSFDRFFRFSLRFYETLVDFLTFCCFICN